MSNQQELDARERLIREQQATITALQEAYEAAYATMVTRGLELELEAERKLADAAYKVVAQMWPGIVGTPEEDYGSVSEAHAAATAFVKAYVAARSSTPTDDLTCYYAIPHRNRTDHHCDCVCILRKGHEGSHFCAWESA